MRETVPISHVTEYTCNVIVYVILIADIVTSIKLKLVIKLENFCLNITINFVIRDKKHTQLLPSDLVSPETVKHIRKTVFYYYITKGFCYLKSCDKIQGIVIQ